MMKVITEIAKLRGELKKERLAGKTIGLVPTMGYFHQGHLSLMHRAKKDCDIVVVSLYVNPIQFSPQEDFTFYPRDFERDKRLAEKVGIDYLFSPSDEEMYPSEHLTHVQVEKITDKLCGAHRPGHFRGVTTVCAKLFNLVQPHKAYFGQKDYQQTVVIKKMVKDLNFNLEVVTVPTVREPSGLALSSRNTYLNAAQRKAASVLFKSLQEAQELFKQGEREGETIKRKVLQRLKEEPQVNLEYLSLCHPQSLQELGQVKKEGLLALAARVGKARLIEHIILKSRLNS